MSRGTADEAAAVTLRAAGRNDSALPEALVAYLGCREGVRGEQKLEGGQKEAPHPEAALRQPVAAGLSLPVQVARRQVVQGHSVLRNWAHRGRHCS